MTKIVKISLRDLRDNIKQTNIGIMGSKKEERGKKKKRQKALENIMAENLPNLEKDIHVQEAQRVPN